MLRTKTWQGMYGPTMQVLRREPVLEYVEMHLADHCNLNCHGCAHFSPASPPRFADLERTEHDLRHLARLFRRVRVLRLMGGEPLLHPEVEQFLTAARAHLPGTEIALATNGLLLASRPESFWRTLARERIEIRVTRYPIALDVARIGALCERFGVRWWLTPPVERFLHVPVMPDGNRDPVKMFGLCRKHENCPFLYEGALYPCAKIAMAWILEEHFGASLPRCETDRVVLAEAESGLEALARLRRAAPWCRFCAYDEAFELDWRRARRGADDWIDAKEPLITGHALR